MRWNHKIAYAIGLITTDGNLSPDGRHISLTSTDAQLLETFSKCLKITNKISPNTPGSLSKKPAYRIQFGDVKLYKELVKIGLTKDKSLTLGSLNVPHKYFPDFLRGHLDGDGSIIQYTDVYLSHINAKYIYDRLFIYFMSASLNHLKWLQNTIQSSIKIKGSISSGIPKSQVGKNPLFRLKFSTKEAKILLKWIYYQKNLPCLKRKYDVARKYL